MTIRINRRRAVATIAGTAMSLSCANFASGSDESRDEFTFFHMADPQLFWGDRPVEKWQTAIDLANRLKPDFVVVGGDMLNRDGDAAKLDLKQDQARADAYWKVAKTLDDSIPLYHVAGNHDVCNVPHKSTLTWYTERFGALWYSFEHKGCFFLTLESDMIKNPVNVPEVAAEQLAWIKESLKKANEKHYAHKIVFLHHPLCLKKIDEGNGYFQLDVKDRTQLLSLFHENGVRATFSGHYHRNAHVQDGELELITTSAVGNPLQKDPPGFRIVKVTRTNIEHSYHALTELNSG